MNKAVPWSIKGVDFDAREAAREAARRSGMSLGEWLNSVIADQAAELGVDVEDIDESDRLEAVTARLAQMSKRPPRRRDDRDDAEETARRRRPAPVRERSVPREVRDPRDTYEFSDYARDRAPPRDYRRERPMAPDPEAILDDAIRAFERGARRSGERTASAISQVARRLEDIETQLGTVREKPATDPSREAFARLEERLEALARRREPEPVVVEPAREKPAVDSSKEAIARLEARLEALARRKEPDSAEASLHALEQKISAMSERHDPRSAHAPAVEAAPDLVRIETKLNKLLEGMSRPAASEAALFANRPQIPPRASLGDAIAQITRRQRALEGDAPAAPQAFMHAPRAPLQERQQERPQEIPFVAPGPDLSGLQKDIATLASRLEETRRDILETGASARKTAQAAEPGADQLRRQIDDMSRALKTLAPRDAVASLEGAISDLGHRIDASRQKGVREAVLQPIEDLAVEVRRSLAEFSPNAGIASLEREIRAMAAKVDAARQPGVDTAALRDIHAQTQEMRDLLSRAIARPAPIETIERQITGLSDRVERLSQRGADEGDNAAVMRSIGEIRQVLDKTQPSRIVEQLEDKIERLGRKIDDAVSQSNASDQFGELAERIDKVQLSLAARPAPAGVAAVDTSGLERMMRDVAGKLESVQLSIAAKPASAMSASPVDTSALERMMRDLAGKLERPAAAAQPADTRRLEEMVQSLAERLTVAGAPQTDLRLVDSLQGQIARLAEKIDAAGASRSDGRVVEQLQGELARFAERLEAGQPRVDPQFVVTLQQQMAHLAERLDQGDASARVLSSLEATIGDLFHRMEDMRSVALEAAETAARTAAQDTVIEAMQRLPAISGQPDATITREIADLRTLQDTADRRTHATLTAVHETLEKVVDRLAVLEDDLAEVRPEPLASGAAPNFARAPAAAVEAPAKAAPQVQVPREPEAPKSRQPAPVAAPSMDSPLDELIEPGSGLPQGRRAAPEAAGEASAQSSFIAAARRAAQSAAAPAAEPAKGARSKAAGVLDNALNSARDRAKAAHMAIAGSGAEAGPDAEPAEAKVGALGKVRGFVNARKRLVLIALIGVIAIAGTWQAMRFLRGPARPEVVDLTGQKTSDRAPAETPSQQLAGVAPGMTQPPADASGASRFVPGAAARNPAEFDNTPVGAIGVKPPASPVGVNLRDAAASGNAAAQFELAVRYADGRTVARDPRLAVQWFEKAAQQNSPPAQYRLGSHFERGIGVDRDAKRARDWYLRAAEGGNIRAMHNLAVLAAEGVDGKPDYAGAASWFRKASEYGVRDSQYNLAILYARGLGIEQNLQQSWMWFSLAASQGDEDAGKKRDDVATRLDAKGLAAAKASYDAFKVRPSEKAANEVATPPGGWTMPAIAADPRPVSAPAQPPSSTLAPKPSPAKGKVTSL